MSSEAQKQRAKRLQDQIDKLTSGNPSLPKTPRELTDQAAEKAREEANEKTSSE